VLALLERVNGEDMQIWYDACTGKHVRYGIAIAKRLRKAGYEVVFTTREHPDTLALAKSLGEKPVVVGKYSPQSLVARLKESANRISRFSEIFEDNLPDVSISSQSVELCRTAFGLNIPVILTADTPYATAVNRLTVPLADTLVISKAIRKSVFEKYGAPKIVQFDGVDEVAWIKDFNPSRIPEFKRPLIIIRQIEAKAAYALGKADVTMELAKRLTSLGNVVFLARRYSRMQSEKLTVLNEFTDTASLVAQADLLVSVGGTIAREAALQGTPSVVIAEFDVPANRYLSKRGFPLFIVDSSRVLQFAKKYIGKKFDVKTKLKQLENPVDPIEEVIAKKQYG
jgi:predicted glycosyltransferase